MVILQNNSKPHIRRTIYVSTQRTNCKPHIGTNDIAPQGGREESLYDLYAVVHHLGALSSGHYVASVKSQTTRKWHYFNDNQVRATSPPKKIKKRKK